MSNCRVLLFQADKLYGVDQRAHLLSVIGCLS